MVGAHGVEAVVAVGEMAEMALGAMEWRHERKLAKDVTREWDWAEVESDLDIQRRENARLKATIQMYEQAFQQLHKQKMETGTISVDRSMAVYDQLKMRVASPSFLDKLKPFQDDGASTSSNKTLLRAEDDFYVKADVDDPNWWLWLSENDTDREIKEVKDGLGSDGYVMVSQEDIVDSIASFIARYISSIPQAKNLTPKELQQAMTQAFAKVEKKGRLRSLWTTGKYLYTAGSWGATALSIYKHPMVIRAASMAVWTSCCLILKLIA
ncbi:uncharacterized protein [Physcomitrium patens]|uniref:Uncharacterized protein n=1 Tax=Physcomitrium patens TaxID=3218 RepID=A0A2K1IIH9_PHYPA|nr:uncharacterized protein LOC112276254 [Physcomitrium patens]PNR29081.1 hypothetical protein PHYPA_027773 [Physcomitrium patens]|eukprot:XP_024363163.1 uncharacterized protein LOC112276254 [Physcomitrella patens]